MDRAFDFDPIHEAYFAPLKAADVLGRAISERLSAPRDSDVCTECPGCGFNQSLEVARIQVVNGETVYRCGLCGHPILIVAETAGETRSGRGCRIGDYLLRNPSDLLITPRDRQTGKPGTGRVIILASPQALVPPIPD